MVVPMIFCGSGGRICERGEAWKAARWRDAGRRSWRVVVWRARVERQRWEMGVVGLAMGRAERRSEGRMREAIVRALAGVARGGWAWEARNWGSWRKR